MVQPRPDGTSARRPDLRSIAEQVARAGPGVAGAVAGIGQPAPGQREAAAPDALGQAGLFTGDTIYPDDGEWIAAVLPSSDRAYLQSLELLGELDFDVLVPWAATKGQPYLATTDREDARRRIGWIIERVRDGGSS